MAKIGQAASALASWCGQHLRMTTPPKKSRLVLVYGGAANTEAENAMAVRRYLLARVSSGRDAASAKSPTGHRNPE